MPNMKTTNKKPAYLTMLGEISTIKNEYKCILLRKEAIADFISDIKNGKLNANQIYDYIVHSDIYHYLSNQCNRYLYFYGNPEFKKFHTMREDFELSREMNLYYFIYNVLLNEFNVNNVNDNAGSKAIRSFFLVNFRSYIIRGIIVPESKRFYPRATDYTTELLTLFHKSAGYEYTVSEYFIEDIMDGVNATMKVNNSIYSKKEKADCISLKQAYTVWKTYSLSGKPPRFRNTDNEKVIQNSIQGLETQYVLNSTATQIKDVLSDELTIEKVKETAEELFKEKELEFFNYWFDKTIFDNDLMSSANRRKGVTEFNKVIEKFSERGQWGDIQMKINKQRIMLINSLAKQHLIFPENYIIPSKGYSHRLFNLMQKQEKKAEAEVVDFSEKRNDIVNRKYISSDIIFELEEDNNIHSLAL